MSTVSIENLELKTLSGSDRALLASWDAPTGPEASEKVSYRIKKGASYPIRYKTIAAGAYASYVEKYLVQFWQVKDGVKVWGNESEAVGMSAEFTADREATSVGVKVTPVSKSIDTYVNKKKTTKKYFDVSASSASVVFSGVAPLEVEAPQIAVSGTSVTVTCTSDDADVTSYRVYLTADGIAPQVKDVSSATGSAVASFTVAPGAVCSAYFEAYTSGGAYASSPASDIVQAVPETPIIEADDLNFDSELRRAVVDWTECAGADEYRLEYTTDPDNFVSAPSEVKALDGVTASRAFVYGLEEGAGWCFRVRAANDTGNSSWSDVSPMLSVGSAPAAPTVFQSKDYAFVGESVVLGWTHNATDGSAQSRAEVEIKTTDRDTETTSTESIEVEGNAPYVVVSSEDWANVSIASWRVRSWGFVEGDDGAGDWSAWQEVAIFADREPTIEFDFIEEAVYVGYHGCEISPFVYIEALTDYENIDNTGELVHISKGDIIWSSAGNEFWPFSIDGVRHYKTNIRDVLFGAEKDFLVHASAFVDGGEAQGGKRIYFRVDVEKTERISLAGPTGSPGVNFVVDAESLTANIGAQIDSRVYRVNPDGSLEFIGFKGHLAQQGITDYNVPFGRARYRDIIVGKNGVGLVAEAEGETLKLDEVVLDFGGKRLMLPYNIRLSHSNDKARELLRFAGNDQPTLIYGDYSGDVLTVSAELMRGQHDDAITLCHELKSYSGACRVRTPDGFSFNASASVSVSPKFENKSVEVSIDLAKVVS